jgi:hypothetical protein
MGDTEHGFPGKSLKNGTKQIVKRTLGYSRNSETKCRVSYSPLIEKTLFATLYVYK